MVQRFMWKTAIQAVTREHRDSIFVTGSQLRTRKARHLARTAHIVSEKAVDWGVDWGVDGGVLLEVGLLEVAWVS